MKTIIDADKFKILGKFSYKNCQGLKIHTQIQNVKKNHDKNLEGSKLQEKI